MLQFDASPAAILARLIRCPSVTPVEGGALAELENMLASCGFTVNRPVFCAGNTPDVENLLASLGDKGPHLAFAGHTDVVPPGPDADWRHPPFSAAIEAGEMYGRGAVDMKGGIACFLAAVCRLLAKGPLPGRLSFLVTGDEEGPAINGTVKLLAFAASRGERFDACVVGEPTNREAVGDTIKVGRRGSLSGTLAVEGRQGHVAYPHLAENPVRGLATLLGALLAEPLDAGNERFQATNLEATTLDAGGNASFNVIPARAAASFNVRFNDRWTPDSLKAEILAWLERAAADTRLRPGRTDPIRWRVDWKESPSDAFLTRDDRLVGVLAEAVEAATGRTPELSTSGGTSDARFVKDYCPVAEFGLVGRTMHMANERVALADLDTLTEIYELFIARWFAANA
jgi:succinyl-diaminopimelate desuccinylase